MSVASVLCPIDFSDPSRAALVYAAAIADHFGARLTLLAVNDPLLVEAAASADLLPPLIAETMEGLRHVSTEAIGESLDGGAGHAKLFCENA